VSGRRLRLTTSRPAGYRRGGQVIGGAAAPAFIGRGDVTGDQLLAILTDPNITVAFEERPDHFVTLTDAERADLVTEALAAIAAAQQEPATKPAPPELIYTDRPRPGLVQPDTAEPQGEGSASGGSGPAAEASQAGGPDATADGSAASAGDVATDGLLPGGGDLSAERTEPTAPELAPAPEPAAAPKPASKGRGKAKGSPA